MNVSTSTKSLLLLAGPTASGKSALALAAAQRLGAEIVNADAIQVYADLDVLSARPSAADMAAVPHHLYGVADAAAPWSAEAWRGAAEAAIEDIWARGRVPLVVGGTGLYLRTLLDGIGSVPEIDAAVRDAVRNLDTPALATALAQEDPAMAARLKPSDRQRLARALEVIRATGTSLSQWQTTLVGGMRQRSDVGLILPVALLPDRAAVYARCDARLAQMLDQGALAEVDRLAARGLDPLLPALKAVGYPELLAARTGGMSLADALAAAQQSTRHYVKRQYTWLRNQCGDWPRVHALAANAAFGEYVIILQKNGLTLQ
jgi:tRNA dimethylallyltransferase